MSQQKSTTVVILLLSFALIGCQQPKEKQTFLPKEYLYPLSELGKGKTFVCKKAGSDSNLVYENLTSITEKGTPYLILTANNGTTTVDSLKALTDRKIVEFYTFHPPDDKNYEVCTKADILEYKIIDDGTKLGKLLSSISLTGKNAVLTATTEETYLKDTVLNWQDKPIECIVMKMKKKTETSAKLIPFFKRSQEVTGEYYYAKGIGMLQQVTRTGDKVAVWNLIEIRDLK